MMPCCHAKSDSFGSALAAAASNLGVGLGVAADLHRMGQIDGRPGWTARLKTVPAEITPQNRWAGLLLPRGGGGGGGGD